MMDSEVVRRNEVVSVLSAAFPGVCMFSIEQVATVLGIGRATIRHWISFGTFPIKTINLGGRRLVALSALVDYIVQAAMPSETDAVDEAPSPALLAETKPEQQPKRGRGRPKKMDQWKAQQQGVRK